MRRVAAEEIGNKSTPETPLRGQTTTQTPSDTASTSSYTPAAGDVVEGMYRDKKVRVIVNDDCYNVHQGVSSSNVCWFSELEGTVKTGHTTVLNGVGCDDEELERADAIAEAYFEQSQPEYKVGDLVEVKHDIEWLTAVVIKLDKEDAYQPCDVRFKSGDGYYPFVDLIRPLSGTYAERQAKWVEFHGLKVGDKVKVTRKFERQEDGFAGNSWDSGPKGEMQGKVCKITGFAENDIRVNSWQCPYFALEPVK